MILSENKPFKYFDLSMIPKALVNNDMSTLKKFFLYIKNIITQLLKDRCINNQINN